MTTRDKDSSEVARAAKAAQARVVAFLANADSYPSRPQSVARIDTHGAYVFLAGADVYKIKRSVRFDYMDFSTLEKRHAACSRELEINQPHAPSIYLGLVAITEAPDGQLSLGGSGTPVEWAVHMRRFAQEDVLARRAEKGPLSADLAIALADSIADFHQMAARISAPAFASRLRGILHSVAAALRASDDTALEPAIEYFEAHGLCCLQRGRDVLERRAAAGLVRRCHGDLHLENIVVLVDRPVLFDALEFDEDLASIDTLYDLAFVLMDLDQRGQRVAANRVFNRYLSRNHDLLDLQGLCVLPVFLAMRAAIRAMVLAQRGSQLPATQTGAENEAAHGYLAAANRYLTPRKPVLILVGGLSGSGKSTLAAALAPMFGACPGALHLRSDLERKILYGVGATNRLPQSAYTPPVTAEVYAILAEKARTALKAGHSVVADAVYAHRDERGQVEAAAGESGARVARLWLEAPADTLMSRVGARVNDASDATPDVVVRQLTYDTGPIDWNKVDAGGGIEETFDRALEQLKGFSLS